MPLVWCNGLVDDSIYVQASEAMRFKFLPIICFIKLNMICRSCQVASDILYHVWFAGSPMRLWHTLTDDQDKSSLLLMQPPIDAQPRHRVLGVAPARTITGLPLLNMIGGACIDFVDKSFLLLSRWVNWDNRLFKKIIGHLFAWASWTTPIKNCIKNLYNKSHFWW
jgi:hypothetical protein